MEIIGTDVMVMVTMFVLQRLRTNRESQNISNRQHLWHWLILHLGEVQLYNGTVFSRIFSYDNKVCL